MLSEPIPAACGYVRVDIVLSTRAESALLEGIAVYSRLFAVRMRDSVCINSNQLRR